MAEAGFFHCPTEKEQDLVQCYVCYKELDGWEANDEPWYFYFYFFRFSIIMKCLFKNNAFFFHNSVW